MASQHYQDLHYAEHPATSFDRPYMTTSDSQYTLTKPLPQDPVPSPYVETPYSDDDRRKYDYLDSNPLSRQHSADDRDTIPLTHVPPKEDYSPYNPQTQRPAAPRAPMEVEEGQPESRTRAILRGTPWAVYTLTLIQIIVFVVELVKNGQLTGTPIELKPSFNPMIGPSPYVLINMGARFVPCMRNEPGIQDLGQPLYFPCPNTTTGTASCSLTELCGLSPAVPDPNAPGVPHTITQSPAPNQWFRFITPIFLHGGIIHISANLLLQLVLGRDAERAIGPLRFLIVYFSSGIFGFVMGGNFAAPGIASTGCSGSLFGLIGLVFVDLLYTWTKRRHPLLDFAMMVMVVAISFVIGLLPSGTDNFSHIGGFLMGLVLGVCVLHSPPALRRLTEDQEAHQSRRRSKINTDSLIYGTAGESTTNFFRNPIQFFKGRKPLWWAWWLLRAGAMAAVIAVFIVLLNNFYEYRSECSWCKYLSCLPVKNWCDIGNLTTTSTTSSASPASSTSPANLALLRYM